MTPYYDHAGITIYHGDCREVLPTLPKVDLVLTDPPYGTEALGGGYGRRRLHSPDGRDGRTIAGDKDLSCLASIVPLIAHSADSWAVSFSAARKMLEVAELFQMAGFEYYGELIWNKVAPGLGYSIRYAHESALVFKTGAPATPDAPLLSIYSECVDRHNAIANHPHQKPIGFWKMALRLSAAGLILDPFMGSGTTLVAAKQLNRSAIGIEIEEKYCEIAAKRLEQEVFDFGPVPEDVPEQQSLLDTEAPSPAAAGRQQKAAT